MCKVMEQFFLGFYCLAGTYRGKKWGIFLKFNFFVFFFFTVTHITTRQTDGEDWWVVNSPCLSAITFSTHNATTSFHYFAKAASLQLYMYMQV